MPSFLRHLDLRDIRSAHRRQSRRPLWKRLLWMNAPLIATVTLLVILSTASVKMLSAVRAYVGAESLWAKGEKEAAYFLNRYEHTRDEADFIGFEQNIAVPLGDNRARRALLASPPDLDVARQGVIAGHNHPDDVAGMIDLFRYFGEVEFMAEVIAIWVEADGGIFQIVTLARQVHRLVQAGHADDKAVDALVERVNVISRRLTPLEEQFSRRLGVASRKTETILLAAMLGLSSSLLGFSLLLARRLMRRNDRSEKALRLSEERLNLAVDGSNHGVWDWDLLGDTIYYSPRVAELLEISADAFGPGRRSVLERMHPADVACFRRALLDHLRRDVPYDVEFRMLSGTGAHRWFRSKGQGLRDARCRVVRMAGSITDVTDRKLAESAQHRHATQQALIAGFGHMALSNADPDDLFIEAVRVVGEGLGYELCRLVSPGPQQGSLLLKASSGWDEPWATGQGLDATLEAGDRFVTGTRATVIVGDSAVESGFGASPMLRAHQVRSGVEMLIAGTHGIHGLLGAYARTPTRCSPEGVDFLRGISNMLASTMDRKLVEQRLTYMAQYDALTRLPNRNMTLDRLGLCLAQARRNDTMVAVLFIDLDRFKAVNDTYGHAAGDGVLVQAAHRMRDCLRAGDTVGRLGGDEFAAVLVGLATAEAAAQAARKIVDVLTTSFHVGGHDLHVSASIGISLFPRDGTAPATLLMNADAAMYRGKASGRNTFAFFDAEGSVADSVPAG